MTDFDDPSAFEPGPEALENVRTRRVLAFVVDYLIVLLLCLPAALIIFFLGIFTFGLAWALYFVLPLATAVCYLALTLGGSRQATVGMAMFSIILKRDGGHFVGPGFAVLHGLLFWALHVTLTPLLLVVSLFAVNKRLLHDILLGATVVRGDQQLRE